MIFIWSCSVVLIGGVEPASGAQKKSKEQTSPITSMKALKPSSEQAQKAPTPKAIKAVQPSLAEQKSGALPTEARSAPIEPNPAGRKGNRPVPVHKKKGAPKAIVKPRTDLMYYGVLEDSQRYDPRSNSHTAGVPHPQTPDLIHDHFQELDRNQDGKIDPVERAFGRIDMDRDLHNRQLQ
jgi:hypothetical protein